MIKSYLGLLTIFLSFCYLFKIVFKFGGRVVRRGVIGRRKGE